MSKTKTTIPSKEMIDNKAQLVSKDIQEKNKRDCQYMYNLLNTTLNNAVNSSSQNDLYTNDIVLKELNKYSNINIENCDDFNEYKKELKARGITYEYYKGNLYTTTPTAPFVSYYPVKKQLSVHSF